MTTAAASVTLADVEAARARIRGGIYESPCVESIPLSQLTGAHVFCKLDYLQRGLNELLFFELFTAGEAVDRKEEVELHRRLDAILREVQANSEAAAVLSPTGSSSS